MAAGWRRTFRLPLGSRRVERDVDDEIAFHLAMREASLRASGLSEEEARRRARARFGHVAEVRAECARIDRAVVRRRRAGVFLEELMHDLTFALRGLRRAPGFALSAILTLALGIGATAAIFSVVYGVLLRPLPFRDAERLVSVTTALPSFGLPTNPFSAPEYQDLVAQSRALSAVGAMRDREATITGRGRPERVRTAQVTASLFSMLGVRATLGRLFTADEDRPGAEGVAVLAHDYWRSHFGADPVAVGTLLRVNGRPMTIVGVLPEGVRLAGADLYLPLAFSPSQLQQRGNHFLSVIGRLAPGATLEQARAELAAFAARTKSEHAAIYPDAQFGVHATPLREAWFGEARPTMLVLLGAVALLLVLASVNVANLLLVRAEARQREMAVRAALGAGRGRLVRQLLTETTLLSLLGAAVGLPLAVLGVRALLALNPGALPAGAEPTVDGVVLAVAAAVVIVAALVAGLAPALQASSLDVRSAIATGAVGGGGRGGRLRSALVTLEVTTATLVLIGAGLVGRSFWRLQGVNPGFARANVMTMDVSLVGERYREATSIPAFYDRLLGRLRALPGVRGAAAASFLPLTGRGDDWMIEVEGRPQTADASLPSPNFAFVTTDYFDAIGVPILEGRGFATADGERAAPVAVVSKEMARVFWPGQSAVGKRFRFGGGGQATFPWMEVVGVAGDVHGETLSAAPRATYYVLDRQMPAVIGGTSGKMTVIVRTAGDPRSVAGAARQAVWAIDPEVAVANVRTLAEVVAGAVSRPRFAMVVLLAFGGAGLLLAVAGVYGVLSYAIARRTRELAIRMALGARPGAVRREVLASGLRLAAIGVCVGAAAAVASSRVLQSLLYQVSATDPLTIAGVGALLLLATLAASYVPARRATDADPASALRAE